MLRDAAVDLLMNRLGQRKGTGLKDQIIAEMVAAQETLEGNPTPMWFLLTEKSDAVTAAGDERVKLPTDFLLEWEEGGLYYVDSDGDEVLFVREDWDVIKYKIVGSGQPEYYDIAGDYFLLRKTPDGIYTLKMRYYANQTSLAGSYGDAANVENSWLKHASDLLIAETGIVIADQYLQSATMTKRFEVQAARAQDRLIRKDTVMRETNKQRFMEG